MPMVPQADAIPNAKPNPSQRFIGFPPPTGYARRRRAIHFDLVLKDMKLTLIAESRILSATLTTGPSTPHKLMHISRHPNCGTSRRAVPALSATCANEHRDCEYSQSTCGQSYENVHT
jgi:hypothetical protein